MTVPASWPKPERLTAEHVLDGFDCGEPYINRFLHEDALKHTLAGFSCTWVIARPEDRAVLGFVALSAGSQAVKANQKNLLSGILAACPYRVAPMVLLGHRPKRLARRRQCRPIQRPSRNTIDLRSRPDEAGP